MGNLSGIIEIGQLDKLIDILSATKTTDATGGQVETWTETYSDVWCHVEYTAMSNEGMRGEEQQIVAYNVTRFTVRDLFTVNETMRLSFEGNEYDIKSISKLGRSRFAVIEAEKRDNETS